MPVVIEELIAFLLEAKEADSLTEAFETFGKKFMGNKFSKAKRAIKKLSAAQNEDFKKRVGEKLHKHIEKHLKIDNNSSIRVDTPKSSWVQYIEWDKKTQLGYLKTKKSPKIYKLPFFPRSAIILIQHGASAGKTIWRKYWRVFGKGSVKNKSANRKRQQRAQREVDRLNKKRGFDFNTKTRKIQRARKSYVRSANIKNTGATGVKIKIVTPKKPGKNKIKII